ncbi:MAG: tyrosine-type recombinase/integrase, partial [Acidimicrobiales bacterium]
MPLNSASRKALEEWFEARTDQLAALAQAGGEAAKAALWLSRTGKPMGSRAVDMVVRRLAAEAKLELSAHVLRHTFVTNLIRSGADIVLVAEIAGHRRLDTTRATACRRRPTRTRPSKRCFGETRATSATSRGPSVTPWWPASHPLGRSEATLAAFIPISKSRAWWD